jgi:two-component system chemotaxis response regulator CheY
MGARILVVDDSPNVRRMIRAALACEDYQVSESEDGEQALASVQAAPPDLVITDIYMPVMDGLSLVHAVRALPALRFIPILILTTESEEGMKQLGRAAGATGWIVKPFEADHLRQVVASVVRTRGVSA